jgi:signal transduction histidine kinase
LSIEQDDGAAVLRVKDNGIGIPKEMLTRVFDLFTRLESAKQKYAGGMGIGLALVRELVEAHGGRVEAFSEGEGRGSEFVVRLPLADDMRLSATDVAAVDQGRYRTPPEAELRAMPVS